MSVAAVVPAAGRGERLGPGVPRALRPLAGTPMLVHAVRSLALARSVDLVVVAAPPDLVGQVRALLSSFDVPADVEVVAGAATRQESVSRALTALPPDVDLVLVHDAARPLAPPELADAVVAALRAGAPAVVPALPVTDTVKRVDHDGLVVETLERQVLRGVQTPQGFRRDVLAAAHAAATSTDATDDAGLVEQQGHRVCIVAGDPEAFKVTRPIDFVVAESVLAQRLGHVR